MEFWVEQYVVDLVVLQQTIPVVTELGIEIPLGVDGRTRICGGALVVAGNFYAGIQTLQAIPSPMSRGN